MASNEQETKAFMTAYNGLKTAAKALETMSHEAEPDLDKMLTEVKRARLHYDQCNQVIENIKSQVESIFSGSVATETDDDFGQPAQEAQSEASGPRRKRGDMDDEIPF